jgi:hypothetical protein
VYTATNTPSPSEGAASTAWKTRPQALSLAGPAGALMLGFAFGVALLF